MIEHYCPVCGPTSNMKRIGKVRFADGVQSEDWACTCGANMQMRAKPQTGEVEEVYTYTVTRRR